MESPFKYLIKLFKYIEPLWLGNNNEISLRRILAIYLCYDLVNNISFTIHKFEIGKSLAEATMLLGLEAGLIAALLGMTTYQNLFNKTNSEN